MSVKGKLEELSKYCGLENLKEEFYLNKSDCERYASVIKKDKYAIKYSKDSIKSDEYWLASQGVSLKPSKIALHRSIKKDISAKKRVLKMKEIELKQDKEKYRELVRQRRDLARKIEQIYDKNKGEIQRGKEREAEEIGKTIREVPNAFREGLKANVKNAIDIGKAFANGVLGKKEKDSKQGPEHNDDEER